MASVVSVVQDVNQTGQFTLDPNQWRIETYYDVVISARAADAFGLVATAVDPNTALAIPTVGELYSVGSILRCVKITPTLHGTGGLNWRVKVEWAIAITIVSTNYSPWLRKPMLEFDNVRYPWVLEYDYSNLTSLPIDPTVNPNTYGDKVTNSAGDPFDPPVMVERLNPLIRVHWAQQVVSFDLYNLMQTLQGTVNAAPVTITATSTSITIPTGTGLLKRLTGPERIWTDGTHYWDLTYEIEVGCSVPVGVVRLQDKGYNSVDNTGQKHHIWLPAIPAYSYTPANPPGHSGTQPSITIPAIPAMPCATPQLLDGNGKYLGASAGDDNNVAYVGPYTTNITADWSPLNLV